MSQNEDLKQRREHVIKELKALKFEDAADWINEMSRENVVQEQELTTLRHLVTLLWPFVRMWPLSGVGGAAMDAHELMANYLGDVDAAKVTAARNEGFDDASGRMADWIEERWLRRMAPDAREDFINEIRGGQWAGGNDEH